MPLGEQPHQFVLRAIGVLVLVDHEVAQPPVVARACGLIVIEQADSFEQKVVEVQGIGLPQRFFVLLKDHRDLCQVRFRGFLIQILRRLLAVLCMADERKYGARLHEFLVQTKMPERRLDNGELILVIVNREAACKPRPDLS